MSAKDSVAALAALAGGTAHGDTGREMRGVATVENAGEQDVAFASSERALAQALQSKAGCIVLDEKSDAGSRTVIRARNPRLVFARIVGHFHPAPRPAPGVHPSAVVDPAASLGKDVSVGPHATIGAGAVIGNDTVIGAGCVVGEGVKIGAGSRLYPNVTIYPGTSIGARAILHSGVVLGSDGFGFVFDGKRYEKFPQVGTLEIGDDVEIGANTTIDRGAIGATTIGSGTKIDNLIQIGHNVTVGEHCVIASLTGISGSAKIGSYVVIAGQVGIGDHAEVEDQAVLGGQCGVLTHRVVRRGQTVWGTPARPIKEYLAQLATLSRLSKRRRSTDKHG